MANSETRTVNHKGPREEVFKKTADEKEALKKAKSEWKKSQKKNGSKA